MIKFIEKTGYRKEIDALRAIAVIAVFIFHSGFLPNGYLGVDMFFVISGYLITKILYLETLKGNLSIKKFYQKRIRRIIPLASFFCLISIPIGWLLMLPDDFENLAQSVIATNFFANNILQYLTTGNYWDVVNEFKPLMHTWSLAIEEQYYFVYPIIFILLGKKYIRFLLPILIGLSLVSIAIYFSPISDESRFYLLPSRFYELSAGGLGAVILKNRLILSNFRIGAFLIIFSLLIFDIPFLPSMADIPLVVFCTTMLLVSCSEENSITLKILESKLFSFLGKISFSIYMWHQLLLAFCRYALYQEITVLRMILLFIATILLSYLTYKFIETPFRQKGKFSINQIIIVFLTITFATTAVSFFIYKKGGVLKDFPELNIKYNTDKANVHSSYNDRIYGFNKDFESKEKVKVLVIGNSFGRDWANILLESTIKEGVEISYIYIPNINGNLSNKLLAKVKERIGQSDITFGSMIPVPFCESLGMSVDDMNKIWCIGTKNFGINSGLFYNYRGAEYCDQRTHIDKGFFEKNLAFKNEWNHKFIDLIDPVIDSNKAVRVFTDQCKFISQDCRHLTKAGAQYYSELLENNISEIFYSIKKVQ